MNENMPNPFDQLNLFDDSFNPFKIMNVFDFIDPFGNKARGKAKKNEGGKSYEYYLRTDL